jgi:hypothetical protein
MITDHQYRDSAAIIGCEVAAIKAVDKVESGGAGIIDGKPVILFEPHVFWKQLRLLDIDPILSDICYPVWGTRPYPSGQTAQYERLERAAKVNREAALQSASWGRFQIMGFNWKMCKCSSLQAFINAMYKSEDDHLQLFTNYIKSAYLDDELRNKDWKGFARGYNGPLFARNGYDKKLALAYKTFI